MTRCSPSLTTFQSVYSKHGDSLAEGLDFVGLISYQAERKLPGILDRIEQIMAVLWDYGMEAICWNEADLNTDFIQQAEAHHGPNFTRAWDQWMNGAGFPELGSTEFHARRATFVAFNNFFSFKTSVFMDYYAFFAGLALRYALSNLEQSSTTCIENS